MKLNKIFSELTEVLDKLDQDREEILKMSRRIIRECSIAIKHIHRKEFNQYREKISNIKQNHKELLLLVKNNPGVLFKYLKLQNKNTQKLLLFIQLFQKRLFHCLAN